MSNACCSLVNYYFFFRIICAQYLYQLFSVDNFSMSVVLYNPGVTFATVGSSDMVCNVIGIVFLSQEETQDLM